MSNAAKVLRAVSEAISVKADELRNGDCPPIRYARWSALPCSNAANLLRRKKSVGKTVGKRVQGREKLTSGETCPCQAFAVNDPAPLKFCACNNVLSLSGRAPTAGTEQAWPVAVLPMNV